MDLPHGWEIMDQWQHRNDVEKIIEHNLGINLAASRMIESSKGA